MRQGAAITGRCPTAHHGESTKRVMARKGLQGKLKSAQQHHLVIEKYPKDSDQNKVTSTLHYFFF